MPFNGNSQASITRQKAITGQTVLADQVNVPFDDVQSMLGQTFLRNGAAPATGDFNLNSFKVTGLGDATNSGDAVSKSYLETAIGNLNANESVTNKSGNYTAVDTDYNSLFRFTTTATLTNSDTSALRDNWLCTVWADGGNVTIDPYLDNTINGQAQLVLQNQQKAIVYRTSSSTFLAMVYDDSTVGPVILGMINGLACTGSGNIVSVTRGAAASDEAIPHLMILPSDITKRMDSGWVVGSGNGGLDVGTIADGTYYIWEIQRPDTLLSDVLFSLSNTNPTLPSSYTRKRLLTKVVRSGGSIQYVNSSGYEDARTFNVQSNAGELGTFAFLRKTDAGTANPNDVVSGLSLEWSNASGVATGTGVGSTAWKCLGICIGGTGPGAVTLFKRVS